MAWWSQMCFTCPEDYFVGKLFVLARKHFFVSLLNLERNVYKIYPEFFRKSYQYCILGVWKNIFTKVFPLKLIKITFSISNFERTSFGKFATTVVDRWTIWVTFFPDEEQILSHSRTLNKKMGFWSSFLPEVLSNLQFTCPHELFNELCFKDFFFLFWSLSKIVQPCVAFFNSLVEAAFRSPKGTFKEKIALTFFWN